MFAGADREPRADGRLVMRKVSWNASPASTGPLRIPRQDSPRPAQGIPMILSDKCTVLGDVLLRAGYGRVQRVADDSHAFRDLGPEKS